MKIVYHQALVLLITLVICTGYSQSVTEPEALGLPGDNFNLYAALDVFQKSKTLEDFEKSINDEGTKINNLDLNDDKNIDYIKVLSEKKSNTNLIILQVPVSTKENQDVAVIEVSKDKSGKIMVQIIGDEELYGKDYIIEPSDKKVAGTPNPGYTGGGTTIINNTTNNYNTTNTTTNDYGYNYSSVSAWPVVVFMYSPLFVPYVSPWYWGFYPKYWRPWAPLYYQNYWGYHSHYYRNRYYRRTTVIINTGHYHNYYGRRNTSIIVVNNRRNGNYNGTYNDINCRKPVAQTQSSTREGVTRHTQNQSGVTSLANRPNIRENTTCTSSTRSTTRENNRRPASTTQTPIPTRESIPSRPSGGNRGRSR